MKRLFMIGALMFATNAAAQEMSSAEFFARDKARDFHSASVWRDSSVSLAVSPNAVPAAKAEVVKVLLTTVDRMIGSQWGPTALKIAKIESNFECSAVGPRVRGGRAQGVMQVMPGSAIALGYDPRHLRDCAYGIEAGVAHMRNCISAGVQTPHQMMACHVAGINGWDRRLNRHAERYKRGYVRLVSRA